MHDGRCTVTDKDQDRSRRSSTGQTYRPHYTHTFTVSDNGPQFASHEYRDFARLYSIEHNLLPAYNPQSNGFTERVQKLKRVLKSKDVEGQQSTIPIIELRFAQLPVCHLPLFSQSCPLLIPLLIV